VSTEHRYVAGTAWLNLLATLGHAYGEVSIERLADVDALRAWLDHERLTPVAAVTEADVAQVKAFRESDPTVSPCRWQARRLPHEATAGRGWFCARSLDAVDVVQSRSSI